MGNLTTLQIVNKLLVEKLRLGGELTTIASPTAQTKLILWSINEIQRELAEDPEKDWEFLKVTGAEITLVNAQAKYDLASDFGSFIGKMPLYYQIIDGSTSDNPIITLVGDDAFKDHSVIDAEEGKPYLARFAGLSGSTGYQQIEFYYVPDSSAAGTIVYYDYKRQPADLAADATKSPVPDILLIAGAYMKIKESQGDLTSAIVSDYARARNGAMLTEGRRAMTIPYRDI